ncbi:MAG TPA: methyltransferase domain-containing protein [Polyangiaceae bacterium]|nr:methyltransferase domain-containing protein [Polyangiaceae bacterium]
MSGQDAHFVGSIPAVYDDILGPLMFAPYADDLAERLVRFGPSSLLEVAAGTGVVTRALVKALPAARIVATDLNDAMLAVARRAPLAGVTWQHADAQRLPFADAEFGAVVCQFGYMFVPDKHAAFREARRVLAPGGRLLFNTWGPLARNEVTDEIGKSVARSFPSDPPGFLARTPFGYHDAATLESALERAGFEHVEVETVDKVTRVESADRVAQGVCLGTPLRSEIEAREPSRLRAVTDAAAAALVARFGTAPFENRMSAVVVTARRS